MVNRIGNHMGDRMGNHMIHHMGDHMGLSFDDMGYADVIVVSR